MGYIKIWVHLVWTTKNREPILTKEIRLNIFKHIRENAENKGIYIDFMLLKGESSNWINKNEIFRKNFKWQDEYFAVSVSESAVNRVRDYIKNQEEHHRKRSFQEEYSEFMQKYGFDKVILG